MSSFAQHLRPRACQHRTSAEPIAASGSIGHSRWPSTPDGAVEGAPATQQWGPIDRLRGDVSRRARGWAVSGHPGRPHARVMSNLGSDTRCYPQLWPARTSHRSASRRNRPPWPALDGSPTLAIELDTAERRRTRGAACCGTPRVRGSLHRMGRGRRRSRDKARVTRCGGSSPPDVPPRSSHRWRAGPGAHRRRS